MNQFIHDYDESLEYNGGFISESDESQLIEHILAVSEHTDLPDFCTKSISYDDALELVQASDSFISDASEYLANSEHFATELLAHIDEPQQPSKLAYSLAYEHTEFATQLLDELLYYRSMGRV